MNRIKELRINSKKQQKEVANELGLPTSTYAGYERGEREPKLETWQKIADYFNVSVGYLMGVSDIKGISNKFNDPEHISPDAMKLSNSVDVELINLFNYLFSNLNEGYKGKIPDTLSYTDKKEIADQISDIFRVLVGQAMDNNHSLENKLNMLSFLEEQEDNQHGKNWFNDNQNMLHQEYYGYPEKEVTIEELQSQLKDDPKFHPWLRVSKKIKFNEGDEESHVAIMDGELGSITSKDGVRFINFNNRFYGPVSEHDIVRIAVVEGVDDSKKKG